MSSPRPHHLMPRGFGGGILLLLVTTTVIEAQSMEEMGMKFISTDIICNDMLQQKCIWKKVIMDAKYYILSLHFTGTNLQATSELGGAPSSLPHKLATFLMRPVKRSFESEGEIADICISEPDA